MNRITLLTLTEKRALTTLMAFTAGVAFLFPTGRLNSQYAAPGTLPKTPEQSMAEVKAANAALLEKQKATLQRLDTLQQEADQLRIWSKRG